MIGSRFHLDTMQNTQPADEYRLLHVTGQCQFSTRMALNNPLDETKKRACFIEYTGRRLMAVTWVAYSADNHRLLMVSRAATTTMTSRLYLALILMIPFI
jgi:hypothetical protein